MQRTTYLVEEAFTVQVCYAEVQALLLVYNDAVTALVSGTDGQLDGCVLIAGTGLLCCPPLLHDMMVMGTCLSLAPPPRVGF